MKNLIAIIITEACSFIMAYSQVEGVHLRWNSTKENATENTMAIKWISLEPGKGTGSG